MSKKQFNGKWLYRTFVTVGACVVGVVIGCLGMNDYLDSLVQTANNAVVQAESSLADAIDEIETLRADLETCHESALAWKEEARRQKAQAKYWKNSSRMENTRADSLQKMSDSFETQLRDCSNSLNGCRQYRAADRKAFTIHLERMDSTLEIAQQRVLVLEEEGDMLNHLFSWLRPQRRSSDVIPEETISHDKVPQPRLVNHSPNEEPIPLRDGSLSGHQSQGIVQARILEFIAIVFAVLFLYLLGLWLQQQYKSWKRTW